MNIINKLKSKLGSTPRGTTVSKFKAKALEKLPTRKEHIAALQKEEFDVLVIGGGVTGAGCALDAVTRGLKTALIEHNDFASGASSRSTKLVHGGVRYLQDAIMKLDKDQFTILREALHERGHMLKIAPHLTRPLAFLMPIYKWWQVPYVWSGMKLYDTIVLLKSSLRSSTLYSAKSVQEMFPTVNPKNLVGGVVYYDGQMDDARFNVTLALTAARYGATVLNYASAIGICKGKKDKKKGDCAPIKIMGARVEDQLTGEKYSVHTKCIINATGAFTDSVRKLDEESAKCMCTASCGIHIVLPGYYSSPDIGLIYPSTDNRVIFLLPWQNHTLVGTTDVPCKADFSPRPSQEQVNFILKEVNKQLHPDLKVTKEAVLASWCGIRPLVTDPKKKDTKSIARKHVINVSNTGLVTVTGGKYTTYRVMAKEAVDAAIKECSLKPKVKECKTTNLELEGAKGWSPTLHFKLMKEFGMDSQIAKHLSHAYGTKAIDVAKLAKETKSKDDCSAFKKIHPKHPYIEAEIKYAIKEYAVTAVDFIARRIRLAFLNYKAANEILPTVVKVMGKELKWTEDQQKCQIERAKVFLCSQMRSKDVKPTKPSTKPTKPSKPSTKAKEKKKQKK